MARPLKNSFFCGFPYIAPKQYRDRREERRLGRWHEAKLKDFLRQVSVMLTPSIKIIYIILPSIVVIL